MRSHHLRPFVTSLLTAAAATTMLWSRAAEATSVVTEQRWVRVDVCEPASCSLGVTQQVLRTDGPALFDESVTATNSVGETGTASQTSTIDAGGVSAIGSITTAFLQPPVTAEALDRLEVTFDVTSPTPWSIAVSSFLATADGTSMIRVTLNDAPATAEEFYYWDGGSSVYGPSQAGGVLAPGQWTLLVESLGVRTNQLAWSVDFELVPEPTTALLLALGLAAFGVAPTKR